MFLILRENRSQSDGYFQYSLPVFDLVRCGVIDKYTNLM